MSVSKNKAGAIGDIQADVDTLLVDTATLKADTTTLKADTTTLKADTTTIKADTTTLKADTTTLKADTTTLKADTTNILADTATLKTDVDNIFEEVEYIEHHIHGKSRTFGKSADQSGTNWATEDRLTPFQAISGAGDYGSDANDEAKVFGSTDTPFIVGHTTFDPGEIIVSAVSNDNMYIIRLVWGTGTMADAISAGQYSTKPAKFDSTNPQLTANTVVRINTPRLAVGTKVWVQIKNNTDNSTLNFFIDSHGYS